MDWREKIEAEAIQLSGSVPRNSPVTQNARQLSSEIDWGGYWTSGTPPGLNRCAEEACRLRNC